MKTVSPKLFHHDYDQSGLIRPIILFGIVLIVLFGVVDAYWRVANRSSAIPEIRSGIAGYCLDDHHDGHGINAEVDTWVCNGKAAQNWIVGSSSIKHGNDQCLAVQNNQKNAGAKVVLNTCNGSSGQIWTIDLGGFENSASNLCLSAPNNKVDQQLILSTCNNLSETGEAWSADTWSNTNGSNVACNTGNEGQKVACYGERQWLAWQSGSPNHEILLADYTDGNGYEEWCADFISYVYKEAGYPFTAGERDGWDEYDANNIQNMGFTLHNAQGYTPQPGDVAFFDYPGGHVELVVKGGQHPTFIYGDSNTNDPSTGNGEMNQDTLLVDGSAGQVVYYLSPN